MLSCPCGEARIGAFLLTFALAWLYRTGIAPMFASLMHGDIDAVLWALLAGLSVVLILYGIAAALTHDDAFRLESFIWSVGVIVFCAYALLHHWTAFDAVAGDYTGTFWLAWIASNAVNIWLHCAARSAASDRPRQFEDSPSHSCRLCAVVIACARNGWKNSRVMASMRVTRCRPASALRSPASFMISSSMMVYGHKSPT